MSENNTLNDLNKPIDETPSLKQPEIKVEEKKPEDELVTIDYFAKVKLRVAQILEAERLEKSEKLVKLKVDLGSELGQKQILAGIAKHYTPESLIGRKIIVVANLKPAKLMGQLSEGMLLAASDDQGNLELLSPGTVMPAGSIVR